MSLKSVFAKPFAGYIYKQIKKSKLTALEDQQAILSHLLKVGKDTLFGKDHHLGDVATYEAFKQV